MDEKDLAQSFNDYIEPSAIPFQFGAPGWWILLAIILLSIAGLIFLLIRQHRRNLYRKQALDWLVRLQGNGIPGEMNQQLVYDTAILLKRIAMARYGRNPVAGLNGSEWIQWLNNKIKKTGIPLFDDEDNQLLSDGIYRKEVNAALVNHFIEKSKNWIRYHHAI